MRAVYPDRSGIQDVLGCLLRDTLATIRNGSQLDYQPDAWRDEQALADAPLRVDSLELLTLAGQLNRLFSLDETGLEDHLLRKRTLSDWTDLVMRSLDDGSGKPMTTGMRFLTSGSTGSPKEHAHSWLNLGREAAHLAERFHGRQRVICLAPRHHIFGFLFGTLLPRALDVPVLVEQEAERALLRGLLPGDLIIAHPLRWEYMQSSRASYPADIWGVSSTGPCEESLIERLLEKGLDRMVEIFGSTETAGIGIRMDHRQPYELFPWWQASQDGSGIAERWATLVDDVRTLPDHLRWDGDRHFWPVGRRDDVVQVGGINVSPSHVASRLCEYPGVAEASVRLGKQGRLKAFIVPCGVGNGTLEESALRDWMQQQLPAHERPAEIRLGDALPRNPLGKLQDWA